MGQWRRNGPVPQRPANTSQLPGVGPAPAGPVTRPAVMPGKPGMVGQPMPLGPPQSTGGAQTPNPFMGGDALGGGGGMNSFMRQQPGLPPEVQQLASNPAFQAHVMGGGDPMMDPMMEKPMPTGMGGPPTGGGDPMAIPPTSIRPLAPGAGPQPGFKPRQAMWTGRPIGGATDPGGMQHQTGGGLQAPGGGMGNLFQSPQVADRLRFLMGGKTPGVNVR